MTAVTVRLAKKCAIAIFIVVFVAIQFTFLVMQTQTNSNIQFTFLESPIPNTSANANSNQRRRRSRKIFIDLGALDGDTLTIFEAFRSDSHEFVAFVWEPQRANIAKLVERVSKMINFTVAIVPKAAWIEDTTLTFAGNGAAGKVTAVTDANKGTVTVGALRFSRWLRRHADVEDYVALKMDIECAEFSILKDLIATDTLRIVDELQLEWHDWNGGCPQTNKTEMRRELEGAMRRNGLFYEYATFDMNLFAEYNGDRIWDNVPKYVESTEWPRKWVDLHYFRNQSDPDMKSKWSIH